MNKISSLIFHNLKKAKGQYISFCTIITITALIMNIALVLAFQTFNAYDRNFKELDTADINLFIPSVFDNDELSAELDEINGIEKNEKHHGVFVSVTVKDFQNSDFDMNTVFYNLNESRTLNRIEVTNRNEVYDGLNAVYIPDYISKFGGFSDKENIVYSIDGKDVTYHICGTATEMQYGNYGTGMIGCYMYQSSYDKFVDEHKSNEVVEYSIRAKDGSNLSDIKNSITALLNDKGIMILNLNDRDTSRQTRTMVCSLLIAIFIALAGIILAVSIFLSNFRIKTTIEDEITEMGVLKGLGYTSNMIIASSVIPYVIVGAAGTLLGSAVSYLVLPFVADILALQSGFSFTPSFDIIALILTFFVPTVIILFFAYISARKIRKLEPINAIRGITGTTAVKNYLPLETTKTSVGVTLVLKQIISSIGQNILLFAVSFGIMILLSFAGTLLYNVNIKPENFMNTISEETPSVIYTANDGKKDELKDNLSKNADVEKVIGYATSKVSYDDGSITTFICEDFSQVTNNICYKGKNPANANEIAIGSAMADKYSIGDKITIKNGEMNYDFTITGFVQSVNNSGEVCELTEEGYAKISETTPITLNVYLKDKSAKSFIDENADALGELVLSEQNYEQLAESGKKIYSGIVSAVTVVLFVISVLVVLLVMYIIINSMISRRRQEYGIYKAMGYSSRQLTIQTAMSFVPVVAVASIISSVLNLWYMPMINNGIFSMIGAMQNCFESSFAILLLFAIILTLVCFLISIVLARPIKKITTYSLLKE